MKLSFIFKERDYENNYFAFGTRNYDSETGRFLSLDLRSTIFEMNNSGYDLATDYPKNNRKME